MPAKKTRVPRFTSNPHVPFQMSTERPPLTPPAPGKKLIVHVLLAIEDFGYDLHMANEAPKGTVNLPYGRGVTIWSWAEYGARCGIPRLFKIFGDRNIRVTACINSRCIDIYPSMVEKVLELDWEFQGHGITQNYQFTDERAMIHECLERIEQFCGYRPRGWIGPGRQETVDTLDLLREAGVIYTQEWLLDDLPCWMKTKHGPMVAVPYTVDLNDARLYRAGFPPDEMYRRALVMLDALEEELEHSPRILSFGLHHYLTGIPDRAKYFEKLINILQRRNDVVFMTGAQIADWFIEADKANDGKPNKGKF